MATAPQNLVGIRYARLVVVEELAPIFACYKKNPNHKTRMFRCVCDCGNETVANAGNLRKLHTQSCGCLQRENGSKVGNLPKAIKHGMCGTPEYSAWLNMIQRCTNPKATRYERYGGRGIKVCDRWRSSFDAFYADVGARPSPKHSIDRYPKNDGDYEPTNVRWATDAEQQRNRELNRFIEVDGQSMCLADAAHLRGIKPNTLHHRLGRGLSVEEALRQPRR